MNALRQALAGLAAAMLCSAASAAAPAAFAGAPEAFYSFSDLVRLASSMEGAAAQPAPGVGPHGAVYEMESASAGASRAPDGGPMHVGEARGAQAWRIGGSEARARPASAERDARYEFSVTARPQGWLLLLSGLAAAGWVARRRQRYPIHG